MRLMDCGRVTEKMNVQHRTSNIECLMGKNGILEETEELVKIFVTSIKTAEKKQKFPDGNYLNWLITSYRGSRIDRAIRPKTLPRKLL